MFKNGISSGLMLWLIFLVALVLLGYPVPLSIIVGAIGGFSGGTIVTWWHSKDAPPILRSPEESEEIPLEKTRNLGIVEAQKRRQIREKRTPRGQSLAIERLKKKLWQPFRRR